MGTDYHFCTPYDQYNGGGGKGIAKMINQLIAKKLNMTNYHKLPTGMWLLFLHHVRAERLSRQLLG